MRIACLVRSLGRFLVFFIPFGFLFFRFFPFDALQKAFPMHHDKPRDSFQERMNEEEQKNQEIERTEKSESEYKEEEIKFPEKPQKTPAHESIQERRTRIRMMLFGVEWMLT